MKNKHIAVRVDDVCDTMNWDNFNNVINILSKYAIKPLLGIIPKNEDNSLKIDEKNKNYYEIIRKLQNEGFAFALHGYDHVYRNKKGGILSLNKDSEMVGMKYSYQLSKIKEGIKLLEKENIYTNTYMAPSHSFDATTIKACFDVGIKYFTDGLTNFNYKYKGIIFIPCNGVRRTGISTICIHPNTMKQKHFEALEELLKENREWLCDFSKLIQIKPKKNFIFWHCFNKIILFVKKIKRIIFNNIINI